MRLIQTIISSLLTFIIFSASFAMVICSDVNRTIFNAQYVKNVIESTNSYILIYNEIPSLISGLLPYEPPTAISRFVINNMSKNSLKSQTDIIVDNFYSYLDGSEHLPLVDLSSFKREVELIKNNKNLKYIAEDSAAANKASLNIPSKIKINNPVVNKFINNVAWVYRFLHSISFILILIIVLCLLLLLAVNKGIGKFHIYISICFIALGFILSILYSFHNKVTGSLVPKILDQLQVSGFKMLSISLYPILLFTLNSMFNYIFLWSICFGLLGLSTAFSVHKLLAKTLRRLVLLPQSFNGAHAKNTCYNQIQKAKAPRRAL